MSSRTARRRDLRLVPVAVVAWGAAGIATQVPTASPGIAAGLWAAVAAVLVVSRWMPSSTRATAALAAVALACAAAVAGHVALAQPTRAAASALDVDGGRVLTVEATVVGKVERSAVGWRFDAVTDRIAYGERAFTAPVPVLVRADDAPPGLDLGARVELRGTAFRAEAGDRPVLVIQGGSTLRVRAPPAGPLAAAADLRRGLHAAVAGLPQPAAGLVAGLAVGDTSEVTADLDAAMKTASLSHLTAVSGANCALVVGLAFAAAAGAGARRGIRVTAGLVALAAFVLLVSPEPSVVRAGAMAAIAMLGVLLGRIGAGVSVLALAVTILLVVDPWLAGSLGFALSAAATAALLLVAGPLADGLSRWMPHPLALALAVPLAAQLACAPLIVLIDPRVAVYGVVANLLAAPAAPAGTVLGLAACLTAGVPLLGPGLATIAWLPSAWIAGVAGTFAALPGSSAPWPEGPPGGALLAVTGACATALIVPRTGYRLRRAAALILAALIGVGVAVGPVATLIDRATVPDWAIVACDVGQGDAVLLRSEGRVALVDTGPDPVPLRACLDRFGVGRIDLLILTHFDLDHRGGMDAVVGRVDVVLHGPPATPEDDAVLAALASQGAAITAGHAGLSGSLGAAGWRVLWPRAADRGFAPGNDAGVIVAVEGGGIPSTVLLGDLSASAQQGLLATGRVPADVAVVKVAHHGSADQEPALYARLAPQIALVTVGENTYGHPREEILEVLHALGAAVQRTDQGGAAALWTADDGIHVWRAETSAAVAGRQ